MTALVILTSGATIPYGGHAGAELTASALSGSLGDWVRGALCGCLALFAAATVLGWGFYAGRCAEYLFGGISWKAFGVVQGCGVLLGIFLKTGTVWTMAETVNGLMAVSNLVAVLMLTPEVVRLTGEYWMCYNLSHRQNKRGKTHERKGNRRDPAAHPAGSQQYDCHLWLLRQRG
jgi:AGCS family alanine or glycine:cation symporter